MKFRGTPLIVAVCLVALLLGLSYKAVLADGGSQPSFDSRSGAASLYEDAVELISDGKYRKAIKLLKRANRRDPGNPDTLNMLAFSERKLGNLEVAFSYYGRVLEMRPDFPEAREYLGEAHIDAALSQVALLRSYGDEGKQSLANLVEALQKAAASTEAETGAAGDAGSW